jgi:hypothetical protein
MKLIFVDPKELKTHERTGVIRFITALVMIVGDGAITHPILIDEKTKTILDGHHRHAVSRLLRLKRVPCWAVSYIENAEIEIEARRKNIPVSKEDVVRRSASGKPYPKKTTRHRYEVPASRPFTLRELRAGIDAGDAVE